MPTQSTASGPIGIDLFKYLSLPSHADRACVILGARCLTYGLLDEMIGRTARWFERLGVAQGDRIAISSRCDLETIALYLSAMRLGVTPALIDPDAAATEVTALVQAARAKAFFADPGILATSASTAQWPESCLVVPINSSGLFNGHGFGGVLPADAAHAYPDLLASFEAGSTRPATVPPEVSAFILFTSGTTSRPKGVEVSHSAVAAHMGTMHRQYGYDERCVVLNGLPLHHSDGINHGPVNIMAAGGTLVRTGGFSVPRLPQILEMIPGHRATHMITVPTVLALISRLGNDFNDVFRTPDFHFVSSTAGPLDEHLWRSFEERFGTMVVNGYGLTETVCEGFYCGPGADTRRIGTIGKPIDIDVRIIDDDDRDVPVGEMGELVLRGSCVMTGYFDAPEETAAVLRQGWLYTGDLAVRDADGFYSITGRKKNVIVTGGINVYPEDVSRTLTRMPGVVEAVTVGVADATFTERVVSCVVLDTATGVTSNDVLAYARAHLAREKVPSHLIVVAELPRGPAGKVALPQVKNLVASYLAHQAAADRAGAQASSGSVEEQVFELAERIFKTPQGELSLDSEPESTEGWNSLAHMDFLVALESHFEIQIAPDDMLSILTLGDAIDYVTSAVSRRSP